MKTNNLTRRERERLFRRNEIIDAAVILFAEKGFDATTLDDIALKAEFGKGTIYNYFGSKEEIYSDIVEEVSFNLTLIFKKADEETNSIGEFLCSYTREIFNYCFANKEKFVLFVRELVEFTTDVFVLHKERIMKRQRIAKKRLVELFASGIKSGEIIKSDPEKLVNIFQHMVFPYVLFLFQSSTKDLKIGDEVDQILNLFFNGVLIKNKQGKC